ncbi:restriction endonuclease [Ramlibacter alkalitolerans]|uniref:Restriction endonuclease n=1 Tax=Ramlibacter alkalitolerans TaxID=2039631 RepID=A0ABS1JT64_9BURK|nr:restriction endonuclease [Ramlibacter alkalitolerans]MBL0427460.1 restriction endonuclease [Ramlibacter alkalitolerans]
MTVEKVRELYEELSNLPADADGSDKRRRGFAFERLLDTLFSVDGLEPRASYRPAGEQIDGSIYLEGRTYLIEAKWQAEPLPASTLYQFKGKVDGKLSGTVGIFISMSGYAKDAVDALMLGKNLNVILVDRRDMDAAILRARGFKEVLKLKLRKASEEGAIYFPAEAELVTAANALPIGSEHGRFNVSGGGVQTPSSQATVGDLLIVCEAESDRRVIATLTERILAGARSRRSIKIVTAMGKLTIPRVANSLWNAFHSVAGMPKVLIVADADGDPTGTATMLSKGLEFDEWVASLPNPSIESWLELNFLYRGQGNHRLEAMQQAAEQLDIAALRLKDEQFRRFHDVVLAA